MAPSTLAVASSGAANLTRRRIVAASILLTILVTSPRARESFLSALRQFVALLWKRVAKLQKPPALRKDFLHGSDSSTAATGTGAADFRGAQSNGSAVARVAPRLDGSYARFADFGHVLPPWLTEGLRHGGFESMKPIQRKILPLALAGQDVVGIAPTGSGKTLAFLVPGLVHAAGQNTALRPQDGPIVLVLAPTRELAVQIGTVAESLMQPSKNRSYHGAGQRERGGGGFNCAVLYGGPRRTDQLQALRFNQSTHLVVATPGRLLDFLRHDAFTLRRVSFFVLDEGDRMLDFGFEPDVTAISEHIRSDRQMLFFSATWPPEVENAARRLCSKGQVYQRVSAEPNDPSSGPNDEAAPADGSPTRRLELPGHPGIALPPKEIKQVVEVISGMSHWSQNAAMDFKVPLLLQFLEDALGGELGETPGKALIFVGTRLAAEELGVKIARRFGLDRCGIMHGARKQDQREMTLKAFREGRLRALVATDVLGRGVDIADVSHVVVFDFPNDIETYVHRVGRTGRNGKTGTAITFFEPLPWVPHHAHELAEVLRACGQPVPPALVQEELKHMPGGLDAWSSWNDASTPEAEALTQKFSSLAPPLEERGSPAPASREEVGPFDANGARVWGYSANGGASEQGRLELRAGGLLRTTWGWGEWSLVKAAAPVLPHCPPPSRPVPQAEGASAALPHCPPPSRPTPQVDGAPHCPPPSRPVPQAEGAPPCPPPSRAPPPVSPTDDAEAKGEKADDIQPKIKTEEAPKEKSAALATHLCLTWNGVTDVVALDSTGLGFDLVSRNGRPASTYKHQTLGRALANVTL